MRFETSQHMKMGQHMKLAPRMIQSMEILQMPLAELEERIEQELESNPTLELADGDSDDPSVRDQVLETRREDRLGEQPLEVTGESGGDEFERLESFEQSHPDAVENEYSAADSSQYTDHEYQPDHNASRDMGPGADPGAYSAARSAGERDAKLDAMAAAPARSASLTDQFKDQWSLVDVDPALKPLGDLLIPYLEEDGYLRTPLETIADRAPLAPGAERPTVAHLERALRALQLFLEPAGVAARTPAEALTLQLDALEDDAGDLGWPLQSLANARLLVVNHLDDLTQNRLPKVAEATKLTLEQIKDALLLLRRLSLHPARRLVEETSRPIIPDAIVEFDAEQDRYIAYLNDTRLPNVRINQEYAKLARDKQMEKKDREFIRTNLGNAQWLLDAVGQRRHTLLRVIRAVVEAQRDFFDYGPQALKPLPMTGVAEQLGIHVATVSRAVAEKYLATPRGVVPLRKFFSGGLQTDGGEEVAWDAIKVALKEIIDGEDKAKPLSDEALVDELKKRGIEIARRTVAKYRDQLSIQPARLRKTF